MEQELRSQRPQQEQAKETDEAPEDVQSSSIHGSDSKFSPAAEIETLDSGHSAISRHLPCEYDVGRAEQFLTRPPRAPEAQITGSSGPEADALIGTHLEACPAEAHVILPSTPTVQEEPAPGLAHARSSEAVYDESFEEPPS